MNVSTRLDMIAATYEALETWETDDRYRRLIALAAEQKAGGAERIQGRSTASLDRGCRRGRPCGPVDWCPDCSGAGTIFSPSIISLENLTVANGDAINKVGPPTHLRRLFCNGCEFLLAPCPAWRLTLERAFTTNVGNSSTWSRAGFDLIVVRFMILGDIVPNAEYSDCCADLRVDGVRPSCGVRRLRSGSF